MTNENKYQFSNENNSDLQAETLLREQITLAHYHECFEDGSTYANLIESVSHSLRELIEERKSSYSRQEIRIITEQEYLKQLAEKGASLETQQAQRLALFRIDAKEFQWLAKDGLTQAEMDVILLRDLGEIECMSTTLTPEQRKIAFLGGDDVYLSLLLSENANPTSEEKSMVLISGGLLALDRLAELNNLTPEEESMLIWRRGDANKVAPDLAPGGFSIYNHQNPPSFDINTSNPEERINVFRYANLDAVNYFVEFLAENSLLDELTSAERDIIFLRAEWQALMPLVKHYNDLQPHERTIVCLRGHTNSIDDLFLKEGVRPNESERRAALVRAGDLTLSHLTKYWDILTPAERTCLLLRGEYVTPAALIETGQLSLEELMIVLHRGKMPSFLVINALSQLNNLLTPEQRGFIRAIAKQDNLPWLLGDFKPPKTPRTKKIRKFIRRQYTPHNPTQKE